MDVSYVNKYLSTFITTFQVIFPNVYISMALVWHHFFLCFKLMMSRVTLFNIFVENSKSWSYWYIYRSNFQVVFFSISVLLIWTSLLLFAYFDITKMYTFLYELVQSLHIPYRNSYKLRQIYFYTNVWVHVSNYMCINICESYTESLIAL